METTPPPEPAPSPAKPSPFADKSRSQLVVLACAVAIAIGCFMPWVKAVLFGSITASGIDGGDGWVFLGGAVVLAVLAWRARPGWPHFAVSVLGVAGFVYERYNIGTSDEISVQLGSGLWVILLASVIAAGASLHELTEPVAGDGFGPFVQRYKVGLGVGAVALVAALVLGREDHSREIGFDVETGEDSGFGFDLDDDEDPVIDVVVLESGFSNYLGGFDDEPRATAGAVIRNDGDDVSYLEVVFTFKDADDRPVGTESAYLYLEEGQTGSITLGSASLRREAASLEVEPVTGGSSFFWGDDVTTIELGPVELEEDSDFGGYDLLGTARNPSDDDTIDSSSAHCVLRRDGEIVGGTMAYLDTLTPGAEIAWETTFDAEGVTVDTADCTAASTG